MRKYIHPSVWLGGLYIGIACRLLSAWIRRGIAQKGTICRLDDMVFLMKPLQYTLLMTLPLLISTYSMYRHEFSYLYLIRYHSWKNLWIWQIKRSMINAILYAAFLILIVVISQNGSGLSIYNWNKPGSYFFFQTYHILPLHAAEVILYLFFMCAVRNFIIENILLFSIWQNSFLQGIIFLCMINCFEIVQKKYRIFYWLISSDYSIWIDQNSRITMFAVTGIYLLAGYRLFQYCINKKELTEHEKT